MLEKFKNAVKSFFGFRKRSFDENDELVDSASCYESEFRSAKRPRFEISQPHNPQATWTSVPPLFSLPGSQTPPQQPPPWLVYLNQHQQQRNCRQNFPSLRHLRPRLDSIVQPVAPEWFSFAKRDTIGSLVTQDNRFPLSNKPNAFKKCRSLLNAIQIEERDRYKQLLQHFTSTPLATSMPRRRVVPDQPEVIDLTDDGQADGSVCFSPINTRIDGDKTFNEKLSKDATFNVAPRSPVKTLSHRSILDSSKSELDRTGVGLYDGLRAVRTPRKTIHRIGDTTFDTKSPSKAVTVVAKKSHTSMFDRSDFTLDESERSLFPLDADLTRRNRAALARIDAALGAEMERSRYAEAIADETRRREERTALNASLSEAVLERLGSSEPISAVFAKKLTEVGTDPIDLNDSTDLRSRHISDSTVDLDSSQCTVDTALTGATVSDDHLSSVDPSEVSFCSTDEVIVGTAADSALSAANRTSPRRRRQKRQPFCVGCQDYHHDAKHAPPLDTIKEATPLDDEKRPTPLDEASTPTQPGDHAYSSPPSRSRNLSTTSRTSSVKSLRSRDVPINLDEPERCSTAELPLGADALSVDTRTVLDRLADGDDAGDVPESLAAVSPLTRSPIESVSRTVSPLPPPDRTMFDNLNAALANSRYASSDWLTSFLDRLSLDEARRRRIREEELKVQIFDEERRKTDARQLELRVRARLRASGLLPAVLDEPVDVSAVEFPDLSPDMEARVTDALRARPEGEKLADAFRIQICRRDMVTLSPGQWLNDEVINFYLNLLMERGKEQSRPERNRLVYAHPTFFLPKFMKDGYASVKRWTKKVDIFAQRYLLVPVHLGVHWCMCIVDFEAKTVCYYDSMGSPNPKVVNSVRDYIVAEHEEKKSRPLDLTGWSFDSVKGIPQQLNGSDCGVFACRFAESTTRGVTRFRFTQEHMPYFRRRMVYEILTKRTLV